jgi:hypothetical protein
MEAGLERAVPLIHAAAACFMTGAVWFAQLVSYPLLARIDPASFPAYQQENIRRATRALGAPMAVEAACALALVLTRPGPLPWLGVGLLGAIWVATAWLLLPAHRRLALAFDGAEHRRLVALNWLRTAAWSLRAAVSLALLYK